jgi:hypothetical protein
MCFIYRKQDPTKGGKTMAHYDVTVIVEFSGEVHADSREEAEEYAYSNWSADSGAQIQYYGVVSTKAKETNEVTEEVDNCPSDGCPDIEEEEEDVA